MFTGTRLKELFRFGERVGKLSGVQAVALFGSVVRGENTAESDIDVAVVYSRKEEQLMKRVEELSPPRVHVTHVTPEELEKNPTLAGALSGEGLLLFGKPLILQAEGLRMRPMMIISYDTSGLKVNSRNKLNHALYGRISQTTVGGKTYRRKYEGLAARPGISKLGKGVLLVPREEVPLITKTLETHGAKWKEIPVWTY
ncbi:MAG: nucleotidyltransferase domain-containing protein [Candidatus Hadarchaeales archaeon]